MRKKIFIGIAEDHTIVRQGFVRMLKAHKYIKVVFEAGNGMELLKCLKTHQPSIILLDIAMPVLDGLEAMKTIKKRYSEIKIIVISGYSQDPAIIEYVKAGANSFLPKNCDIEMLVEAIYQVSKRGYYFDKTTSQLLESSGILSGIVTQLKDLTEKEIVMLRLFCAQKTLTEISALTGIEEATVSWYKHIIQKKTDCKDEESLLRYAINKQIVTP